MDSRNKTSLLRVNSVEVQAPFPLLHLGTVQTDLARCVFLFRGERGFFRGEQLSRVATLCEYIFTTLTPAAAPRGYSNR